MKQAMSEITREVDKAMLLIGGSTLILLLGVTFAMIYIVVKYNRKKTKTTTQIHGHLGLELTWTIIPTIIVIWMFWVGMQGFTLMRTIPKDGLVVEVTGRQWAWDFYYPEDKVSSSEMVVPVNTNIKCVLNAPVDDVLHSFYLPQFRNKEDVVPGKETYMWFKSESEGVYDIFCAEFCGKDHAKMLGTLRVVSLKEYRKWVEKQIAKRYKPLNFAGYQDPKDKVFSPEDLNISGEKLYGTYCASCHGTAGDGSGLEGARNFTQATDWKNGSKVSGIYRTLMNGIPDTDMRAYPGFTPWERVALAHHVRSFQKNPPKDTKVEYDSLLVQFELDKMTGPKKTIPVEQAMEILVKEKK